MGRFLGQFKTRLSAKYFDDLSRFSTLKINTERMCVKKNDDFPPGEKSQGPRLWGRGEEWGGGWGGVPSEREEEDSSSVPWVRQQARSSCERKHLPFLLTIHYREKMITAEKVAGYGPDSQNPVESETGSCPRIHFGLQHTDSRQHPSRGQREEVFSTHPLKVENIALRQSGPQKNLKAVFNCCFKSALDIWLSISMSGSLWS